MSATRRTAVSSVHCVKSALAYPVVVTIEARLKVSMPERLLAVVIPRPSRSAR
jgi:hypothetical protein